MTQFTHHRCGGVLVEIEPPKPFQFQHSANVLFWSRPLAGAIYARCDRCGLAGEVGPVPR